MSNLSALTAEAIVLANQANDLQTLDQVRVDYLGKKGHITQQLKLLGELDPAERPAAGAKINEAKEKSATR